MICGSWSNSCATNATRWGNAMTIAIRFCSSTAPNFVSEPHEVQTALTSVSQAIAALKAHMPVTWLLDSGFDDVAVWRTIWEQQGHLVCRIAHPERLVEREDGPGGWQTG